ncbi:MAG: hypothetical protein JWQ55_6298 [Rhodopila sp.]|nr:hypothetical protein [Rhodopila sp.]
MTDRFTTRVLLVLALAASVATAATHPSPAAAQTAAAPAGQTFATADDAVTALIAALRESDTHALNTVLGPGTGKLINSGDHVADDQARRKFLASYDEKHQLVAEEASRMVLHVGPNDWPLPLPVVQVDGRWHFDSQLGAQEIVDRRIGENEIAAIRTALAHVDAQKLYFSMASDAGGAEYAQRLISRPGQHDGLYWPAEDGEPDSPLAPLIAQAQDAGDPGEIVSGKQVPYQGYFYRILKGQGANAPGGATDYVSNGHMTKGFALVAWPARFGGSGIMTFIVDQDGIVFQKDLGQQTDAIASEMKLFEPDLSWARVDVVDE